jgi:hypothetical protein
MSLAKLKSTHNYGKNMGVKILVYGKAGVGKTVLCSTCPNPVILSAESGLLSLAWAKLPFWEIRSIDDLREAYRWVSSSHEARMFETVCLDSISEIAERVLVAAAAKVSDGRAVYGDMQKDMTKVIKEFRDLPGKHVYMSAKQERVKTETGALLNQPMMPGNKMGQAMPYFPDEVFQLDIGNTPDGKQYRFLRTQPDFSNDAKDRSGRLDPVEEPNLGKVIRKILGA